MRNAPWELTWNKLSKLLLYTSDKLALLSSLFCLKYPAQNPRTTNLCAPMMAACCAISRLREHNHINTQNLRVFIARNYLGAYSKSSYGTLPQHFVYHILPPNPPHPCLLSNDSQHTIFILVICGALCCILYQLRDAVRHWGKLANVKGWKRQKVAFLYTIYHFAIFTPSIQREMGGWVHFLMVVR